MILVGLAACAPQRPRAAYTPPPQLTPTPTRPAPRPASVQPPRPAWQARKVIADGVETPEGRFHIVKPGETGIAIARAYGVDWGRVVASNGLKPPYTLEVGDRLRLPSRNQVAAMTALERAKAFNLDIDDLITGGEPAAPKRPDAGAQRPVERPVARAGAGAAHREASIPAPLPAIPGGSPRFAWPVEGRILSGFGAKPGGRYNDGVNLKASAGTAVRAAADGVVAYAGDAIAGFGNLVLVKHADGWVTAYGHNEALLVRRGDRVRQGDAIARAGSTGAVTEPQVHFELRRGRLAVDPAKVIGGR